MKDEEKKTAERFNIEDDAFYNMFHVSVEEAKRLADLYSIHTPFPADDEASED